jgi:hypothetical protein
MSFGRHRQREETPKEEVKLKRVVISPPKKETTPIVKVEKPKEEVKPEVKEELPVIADKEEISQEEPIKEIEAAAEEVIQQIEKEQIERIPVKEKKPREDKKNPNLCGVVGQTIEVREFRAIVKKKGEQINDVLSKLLHKYNTENYNL